MLRKSLQLPYCLLFLLFYSLGVFADDSDYQPPVDMLKKAEKKTEESGIKVGMSKDQVLKILGDKFVEIKNPNSEQKEKIYTWMRSERDFITVTFDDQKVIGVTQGIFPEKKDN